MLALHIHISIKNCSQLAVPRIDLSRYLNKSAGWQDDCRQTAELMRKYGLCYAHDPRIDYQDNQKFQDLMEEYFALRSKQFDEGICNVDVNDEDIPVGLKPKYFQKMPPFEEEKKQLKSPNNILTPIETIPDPTWRYHFNINSQHNIKPQQFPEFGSIMQRWGTQLSRAGLTVSQMIALGLGLQKHDLRKTIENGLLNFAPPAVDLSQTQQGDVITGLHKDLSLLTVHGRCRYAGLYAWLLTNEKFKVKLPQDHLLIQAGTQIEWYTGGYLKSGIHEVIHNQEVQAQKQRSIQESRSLWRVASTLFCSVQNDLIMKPFDKFRSPEIDAKYPAITAQNYLLKKMKLYVQKK